MDVKCVRVLRPYEDDNDEGSIYIDREAQCSLNKNWGEVVEAMGRRKIKVAIKPLRELDQDGFIARAGQKVIDALFIEYGEEILLH